MANGSSSASRAPIAVPLLTVPLCIPSRISLLVPGCDTATPTSVLSATRGQGQVESPLGDRQPACPSFAPTRPR
ncbi:hypothetical protein E2562_036941 [Oryza meyeriana var. granulata]|uniref:Uncharacterized protein n=1 Tax=Oryza meyeriana var. granulata TaxID=110450 RepID=A0A6G1C9T4_9ORYZ|nr:hypothetical protein E2562_036941 [Oryza meyeriana var. granulata]